MTVDLADHQIPGSRDAFYIPNFVTQDEEEYLMRKVCMNIVPKASDGSSCLNRFRT